MTYPVLLEIEIMLRAKKILPLHQKRGYVYLKETEIKHPMKGCRFFLTSPERQKTFCSVCPYCTVNDSLVRCFKTTCLQHLSLILNKKLHTLNWGCSSLRNNGSCSTKSKIFCKAQLFLTSSYFCCCHLKGRKINKIGLELLEKLPLITKCISKKLLNQKNYNKNKIRENYNNLGATW